MVFCHNSLNGLRNHLWQIFKFLDRSTYSKKKKIGSRSLFIITIAYWKEPGSWEERMIPEMGEGRYKTIMEYLY